jgi:hypothetical protein
VTISSNRDGSRRKARGSASRSASGSRPRKKASEKVRREPPAEELAPPPEALVVSAEPEPLDLPLSAIETTFAGRMPPPEPERPRPVGRRAIFLDVENTSRAQHLAHVIDHLGVDPWDRRTELVAVANWRVVGHEAARLLAQRGAHLVHSAPSTGVRDWSDLRIAVAAGIWLASARPGDLIEIVSDDRAFDAVGDVAASLGIAFRRLSYRRLVKEEAEAPAVPERPPSGEVSGSRRRRRRRGRGSAAPHVAHGVHPRHELREGSRHPASAGTPAGRPASGRGRGPAPAPPRPQPEPHTAPHDELVSVVRGLIEAAPRHSVIIDAVANALKSRGFQRPPGSPRLVTRLRRIKELVVSPSGTITLAEDVVGGRDEPKAASRPVDDSTSGPDRQPDSYGPEDEPEPPEIDGNRRRPDPEEDREVPEVDGNRRGPAGDGNRAPSPPSQGRRRRRRRWRGGQRRPASAPPTA